MKRPVTIPCIFSAFLMSACTLTPPQSSLTAEDAAAQKLAIQELEDALLQEGRTVAAEAREAAEAKAIALAEEQAKQAAAELAQREAEAKAEAEEQAKRNAQAKAEAEAQARQEAEEQARRDAQAKAEESKKPRRAPQLLSSRSRRSYTQVAEEEEASIVPTAEQQAAALKLLSKQEKPNKPRAKHQPAKAPSAEPTKEEYNHDLRSTLRVRRFAPPEEGSSQDNDTSEPMPNSVELKGFRSPVMKGQLPMNIDGKIIKED